MPDKSRTGIGLALSGSAIVTTSFSYTGHPGTITVAAAKATSTDEVSVWEGTFNTPPVSSGVFNCVMRGSSLSGYAVSTSGLSNTLAVTGTISGTSISGTVTCISGAECIDGTFTGTINGSSISGTTAGGSDGTFSGTRTL